MDENKLRELRKIFDSFSEIKLVYFFGSKAAGKSGPLSDYDFAVYLEEKIRERMADIKFQLYDRLSKQLQTDKLDIVILNLSQSPELNYQIIKEGKLVFEKEPYKVLVEPVILNKYFDFKECLRRYGLTRV